MASFGRQLPRATCGRSPRHRGGCHDFARGVPTSYVHTRVFGRTIGSGALESNDSSPAPRPGLVVGLVMLMTTGIDASAPRPSQGQSFVDRVRSVCRRIDVTDPRAVRASSPVTYREP